MKRGSGHLLRFIDLGLLLLLAFLSVAELNPTLQVPLPGKPATPQQVVASRITFNQNWDIGVKRLDHPQTLCQVAGILELAACMEQYPSMRFLLSPREAATVQQIVTLLDFCRRAVYQCSIEPIRP